LPGKTPSPEKAPAFKAASSPARMHAPVFETITSDDGKRSLASARKQKKVISERIRTRTATSSASPKTK